MPEAIGIEQTMDMANNLNIKTVLDILLLNAAANQKQQQDEANAHRQAMNTIRESSIGQIVNRMNSVDPIEAAAVGRVHRTPSGEASQDIAGAIALAQEILRPGKPVTVPIGVQPQQ